MEGHCWQIPIRNFSMCWAIDCKYEMCYKVKKKYSLIINCHGWKESIQISLSTDWSIYPVIRMWSFCHFFLPFKYDVSHKQLPAIDWLGLACSLVHSAYWVFFTHILLHKTMEQYFTSIFCLHWPNSECHALMEWNRLTLHTNLKSWFNCTM